MLEKEHGAWLDTHAAEVVVPNDSRVGRKQRGGYRNEEGTGVGMEDPDAAPAIKVHQPAQGQDIKTVITVEL